MDLGVGMSELLVLGIVALVVVGPRDLPLLMRRVSEVVRRAREMAGEFRRSFDEMGREIELEELRREVAALRDANPVRALQEDMRALDAEARRDLETRS